MDIIKSVTLGIVQGLTEFLPISSTAHLKIVPNLLGWNDPGAAATAVIQLGTMGAVIAYFARDLAAITRGFLRSLMPGSNEKDTATARMGRAVIVGTIPICVVGLALKDQIESTFRSNYIIGTMLIVMALVLFAADKFLPKTRPMEEVQLKDGIIVGLAQAIALVPGASRSGSTLAGAFLTGLNREAAARFSFLLSVPAVLLSGLFQMKEFIRPGPPIPGAPPTMAWTTADLAIATVVSGLVGYASIAFLLRYLRRHDTKVFVIYRLLVGALVIYLTSQGRMPQ